MENASKALIMAASVLIALMIIGALILMFNNLTNYQSTKTVSNREAQVIEFNNQYETYNRKNVRGSDLLSLLNRATDYNKRTSSAAQTGEEGKDLLYEPVTITFTIQMGSMDTKRKFVYDENQPPLLLVKPGSTWKWVVSGRENTFEDNMKSEITDLEEKYTADSLTKMVKEISNILSVPTADSSKEVYNKCCNIKSMKVKTDKEPDNPRTEIAEEDKRAIRKYYEYVQFKRARFDCIEGSVEYNKETGRITKMEFEFNGKFE